MLIIFLYGLIGVSLLLPFIDIVKINYVVKKRIFACVCIWAMLIVTFRDGIGYDYYAYIDIYEMTPPLTDWYYRWEDLFSGRLTFVEIGYLFINALVQATVMDPTIVFFFMSAITFFIYYKTIPEMTHYIFSSFLLYIATVFFYKEMGQIRHGLSTALCLLAVYYLSQRNKKLFLIWNTVAVMFHKTALAIYLMFLLQKLKWNRLGASIALIACAILYNIDITNTLLGHIGAISLFADQTEAISKTDVDGLVSMEKFLFPFLIGLLSVVSLSSLEKKYKLFHLELTMLISGLLVMAAFHGYKEFGQRISSAFLLSEIFLLPQIMIGLPRDILGKSLGVLLVIAVSAIYIYHTLQTFPM